MTSSLVIDEHALHLLLNVAELPDGWFESFRVPPGVSGLSLRRVGDISYLLSSAATPDSRCAIIHLTPDGFFGGVQEQYQHGVFQRILRAALSSLDKTVRLPASWAPYHHDNLLVFYALTIAEGRQQRSARVIIESRPLREHHVFVVELVFPPMEVNLRTYAPSEEAYSVLIESSLRLGDALRAEPEPPMVRSGGSGAGFEWDLHDPITMGVAHDRGVDEWYMKYLTDTQRRFVDHDMVGPVKLRGAAGTGKTLSMAVKALRTVHTAKSDFRCLFITHSWSTSESVRLMSLGMDSHGVLRSADSGASLEIATLQGMATRSLRLNEQDTRPLSDDAYEGKLLQLELIESLLLQLRASDWAIYEGDSSQEFRNQMNASVGSPAFRFFAWNIMNEFACVLGADRTLGKDRYMQLRRQKWMMQLREDAERSLLFDLYGRFNQELRDMRVLATYQVMNDFLRQLDFYSWEQLREKQGYDLVLVDEFHLFNNQERLAFAYLTRDPSGPRRVAMALDPRQSPRETYFGLPDHDDSGSTGVRGLGKSAQFRLETVFRHTPQISALVRSLDESWPGLDLSEEWDNFAERTATADGELPNVHILPNADRLYSAAFARARALASQVRGGGRARVAVLCLDTERFGRYVSKVRTSELDRRCIIVRSRDDSDGVRNAGTKFVLSQPEYVAGLQFETVLLLDANQQLVPRGMDAPLQLRRVLSMMYLGMSRAEKSLEIFATDDAGGLTQYLRGAVDRRIVTVDREVE